MYARANLVPVSKVVEMLDAMIALFRTWEDKETPYAPELIALTEFFATPLRSGDMAELKRRGAVWATLDEEAQLQLLRTMLNERTNE